MKRLLSLLVLAAVMLTPILVRAEEQLPESTRSGAAAPQAQPIRPAGGGGVSRGTARA